jgi:hypothetical protein
METLKNILPGIAFTSTILGGIMLAFGNDYGIIGMIPGLYYIFTEKD